MNVQGYSPMMSAPVQPQAATSGTGSTSSTSNSSNSSNDPTSASALQSTFLNLLVTELQNQDPTQPVDPTEMVSQMVSLNQLDQLISINQTLTSLTTPTSTAANTPTSGSNGTNNGSSSGDSNPPYGVSSMVMGHSGALSKSATTPAGLAFQDRPAFLNAPAPGALMNLYGNIGVPSTYSNNFTAAGGR
jgi:flagellar basal-body rod modification protein FlgD